MLSADRPPPEPSKLEAIVEQVAEAMGSELRSERWGPRLRVTAVFSILTLAMLALLVRVMLVPAGSTQPGPLAGTDSTSGARPDAGSGPDGSPAAGDGSRSGDGASGRSSPHGASANPGTSPPVLGAVAPAKFERPPTFAGERQPADALRLLEQAPGLPALIETLGRRALVAGEGVSPAVEREWIASLDEAGRSWPLMEPRLRETIVGSFVEVMRGMDNPALADRLLAPIKAKEPVRTGKALWSAAFRSGLLAEMVARASVLPPGVVAAANEALREALRDALAAGGRTADGDALAPEGDAGDAGEGGGAVGERGVGFVRGAGARLDAAVPFMVEQLAAEQLVLGMGRDQGRRDGEGAGQAGGYADLWEAWITAQRALRSGPELQRAYAAATGAILRSGMDLSITGPGSDVLGRLVTPLLDFNGDSGVRTALLEWFMDPAIRSDALWVLTSMMLRNAGIAWFRSDLLVDWNFDAAQRAALRDAVAARWVPPATEAVAQRPPIAVPADLLDAWRSALRAVELAATARTIAGSAELPMRTLFLAATLNEAAAAIEVGQEERARDLVREVQGASGASTPGAWPPRGAPTANPVGTPTGTDGDWARQHVQGERNMEQRLATLRQLRTRPGGDLGPRDAEVFVREVVRGSPVDARSVARAVLMESFRYAPNVLIEFLDQLPDAGPSEELSQVIADLTQRPLPPARSPEWMHQARLALLSHLLGLRRGVDAEVDVMAAAVAEVMRERTALLPRGAFDALGNQASPQQSLARLVDAWRERAGTMAVARPAPASLVEIDRRRALRQQVAFGAVVAFVAEQVSHLELLAYVLSGQAPWLQPAIMQVILEAAESRSSATSALAQAVSTELAIARLWELAFAGTVGDATSPPSAPPMPGDGAPAEAPLVPAGGNNPTPPARPAAPQPGEGGVPRRPTDQPPVPPPGVEPPMQIPPPVRRLSAQPSWSSALLLVSLAAAPGAEWSLASAPLAEPEHSPALRSGSAEHSLWRGQRSRSLDRDEWSQAALAPPQPQRPANPPEPAAPPQPSPPPATPPSGQPAASASPLARWIQRLETLRPDRPTEYFELAEEVADSAAGGGPSALPERALARQLFGLAGALAASNPQLLGDGGLARSAILALAELVDDPVQAARLRTAAMLLDRRGGATLGPDGLDRRGATEAAALAFSEALSYYRRGQGAKVSKLIEEPAVGELVDRYGTLLDGGPGRLREDAKAYRGQNRPTFKDAAVTRMLQLEVGLLAGRDRPWSADRLLTDDEPLAEVDPGRIEELLMVDVSRPVWRNGRWMAK